MRLYTIILLQLIKKCEKTFLILIATSINFLVLAQNPSPFLGIPVVKHFGTEEYDGGIQNYDIKQDQRGLIYAANNLGLLEYDGNNWRRYSVSNSTKVRTVFTGDGTRIYIGAQDEFGYFFPDQNGRFVYHSLVKYIPEKYRFFNDIWRIYPSDSGCVFASVDKLFFYEKNNINIKVLEIKNAKDFTYFVDGRIYANFNQDGLNVLNKFKWIKLSYGEFFKNKQITSISPLDNKSILIATYENGIYQITNNQVHEWAENLNKNFTNDKINKSIRLRNGFICIGTNNNGLYILNQKGELVFHFTKGMGLANRTVLSIYEDNYGNIWLGLNNGIAKIEWQSPFSYINEDIGLQGTGYTAYSYNNRIYYGTNTGLFYSDPNMPILPNTIKRIEGIDGQVYSIESIDDKLFIAAHNGAFILDDQGITKIKGETGWWTFRKTPNVNKIIAGTYDGLYLIEKDQDKWKIAKKLKGFNESSRVMEFDNNGKLWMTHGYKGVYAFDFNVNFDSINSINYYGEKKGFPSNILINVFKIDNKLIFGSESGIYKYVHKVDSFMKDTDANNLFGQTSHIREVSQDSYDNIYFDAVEYSGMIKQNGVGDPSIETNLFNKIHPLLNDDLGDISILDDKNILFAAKEGFIHFNSNLHIVTNQNIEIFIRNVKTTKSDSIIFGGNFIDNGQIITSQPHNKIPKLSFNQNSVSFSYSAIAKDYGSISFRYQLEGYESNWSAWTQRTEKEYTNLNEGKYTFHVEAKDIINSTTASKSYEFIILPPWYRSVYAQFIYSIVIISLIISGIILLRRRHDKEKALLINRQKEEITERENKIKEVSSKSKAEIDKLKTEKLKSEIAHKNKELATSTMHLIDKNEFINSIKGHIHDLISSNSEDIKNKLKKIIREIDKNMESDEDWDQFALYFDQVHGDFLKKIQEDFPNISPQEVKLCAYLRMNMSTKEIANLLKISVRGVEIGRYRLRKKLQIDKTVNLNDFMMKY